MGLFSGATKLISNPLGFLGGGSINLEQTAEAAFKREQERLEQLKQEAREEAAFTITEGQGIAEKADVAFGDELDLELLTPEERKQRSTGIKAQPSGLLL